ncbi:MAG: helix-turn-helix domain-containing protein [Lachnospiraceae bacterium]|nr:helix-turn-helix domain-containing protein [Lachnospiraceae bacterium]
MVQQLGLMLFYEREKMGETQRNIAEGIISISELSRVECGELEIDYFTLQALFERLGKSIDKLELAVSGSEYDAIAYRIEIERSIESWDYALLRELLRKYSAYNDKKRPVHKQYMTMLYAIGWYVKKCDYASCLHWMELALTTTLGEEWKQNARSRQRLCNQEIKIMLAIAYCQWKLGDTDALSSNLEQLGRYILRHYTDTEEQVKVYPHCAWLLGQLYLEQNRVEDAYAICRKGMESLIENGSLSPLWEMLELEEICLQRLRKEAELARCRKYQEAIAFLYKVTGKHLESNMMAAFMKSSFQGELVITNELVRDLREAKGLSQEELCEGICAQETLSKIETCKRSPNKKNLYKLLKKMGMERENYYGFIEADKYELYEKVREYNRCFPKGKYEEAKKLLDEIEQGVDMTTRVNRQFVGMERIYEQTAQNKISREYANKQLREMLQLTMPSMESKRMVYRVPFRTEYMLWNKIAINLRRDDKVKEALQIYEELMNCYKKSKVVMRFHAVPGMSLYINYTGFLEANNELEKALEIGKEGVQHSIECCRGDLAGDILANLSLIYGKQGLPAIEETYLRYGYYLICLYDRENVTSALQKAYQDKFHDSID